MLRKTSKEQPKLGKVDRLKTKAHKLHEQADALEENAEQLQQAQSEAAAYYKELGENPEQAYAKLRSEKRNKRLFAGASVALALSWAAHFTDIDERATDFVKTKFNDAVNAIQDLKLVQLDTDPYNATIEQILTEMPTNG